MYELFLGAVVALWVVFSVSAASKARGVDGSAPSRRRCVRSGWSPSGYWRRLRSR